MNAFLRDLSGRIDCNSHAVLVVDRAAWHRSKTLRIPSNITLFLLPPYCPELNPIERLWLYMKKNYLSGRIFKDLAEVMQAGKKAWQRLGKNIIRSVCAVYGRWFELL
jgi:transposase